jgi:hypothetical protein
LPEIWLNGPLSPNRDLISVERNTFHQQTKVAMLKANVVKMSAISLDSTGRPSVAGAGQHGNHLSDVVCNALVAKTERGLHPLKEDRMAIVKQVKGYSPTHRGLVNRMALWLKNVERATVVMSELKTYTGETPDIIGWFTGARSILIECKVQRGDFLADGDKHFRQFEERGMGDERYFAAPYGLLKKEEIPEGWGLFEVDDRCVRTVVKPESKPANKRNECIMLMSALRRLEISTAVFVRHDTEIEDAPKAQHTTTCHTAPATSAADPNGESN